MAEFPAFFLRNIWYYAIPSQTLAKGKMLAKTLLGEPVVFARNADGSVFALRDVCPHRSMPLSCGSFDGQHVECCYHGWKFDSKGTCRDIPWLTGHEEIDPTKIKVRTYPVQEIQGNIWIFMAEKPDANPDDFAHKPPIMPGVGAHAKPAIWTKAMFPCHVDHGVIGLMDPAHGPFVHQAWWWRGKKSIHEKVKAFGASPFGFVMKKHRPSSNSFGYKILGGVPHTEIFFQLPGTRIEHIEIGQGKNAHHVINLTCVTPINETETEITHLIYWTQGWLHLITPFFRPFMEGFIEQDKGVVVKQQMGLRHEKSMLLLKDADTLARWYFQLKQEYVKAVSESRAFNNPVPEVTLRWRS
jgi:phenylpropionate dioxygenase-like ring-hydroxylating dioxygenase large terminal subunit